MESSQPLHEQQLSHINSTIDLKDFLWLCLHKWLWFVVSILIAVGIACFYILSTPKVYQRSATMLIKEDSKSSSIAGDMANVFSEMGLNAGRSNIYNEVEILKVPATILEVVKRLSLDVNYLENGQFHKNTLYGEELPVKVIFHDLKDEETASLTLTINGDSTVILSNFKSRVSSDSADDALTVSLNSVTSTPLGKVTVIPTMGYSKHNAHIGKNIAVVRTNLYRTTDDVRKKLTVAVNSDKSTIINISYNDVHPQRATDIITTLIAVYKENWMEDKNQMTLATSNFINERLATIERELGGVDEEISSYKSNHLLPDIEMASNLYLTQSGETNSQLLKLNTQRSMAQYILETLTKNSNSNQLLPANSGIESQSIEAQIAEYNKQQLQRNSIVANSSETNPLVVDYDQNLVALRKAIIESVNNHLVTLNTQIASLKQYEKKTNAQIASNPDQAKFLQSVGREQKVKEALYLFLLQKREENELSKAFTAYNTRIISAPMGKLTPVKPVKRNIFLAAIVLGLLLPIVVLFIHETFNTRIRSRKDIEGLKMPFLGEIPLMPSKRKKFKWVKQKKSNTVETPPVVVKAGSRNIINEAFRVLRTNLEFIMGNNNQANVFAVTSFNPNSGKSFVTANIATSFAIRGSRVLVIDGDMRHASTSAYISSPKLGLSDYLNGSVNNLEQVIYMRGARNLLGVIPVGTIPPNPTELLLHSRLEELIMWARTNYDYVFIDCPPIEIVADAQIINQFADRTLFVVRSGLFEKSMLPELQKIYSEKHYKNMALILNGTENDSARYGYGYRNGYSYGYYSNDSEENE